MDTTKWNVKKMSLEHQQYKAKKLIRDTMNLCNSMKCSSLIEKQAIEIVNKIMIGKDKGVPPKNLYQEVEEILWEAYTFTEAGPMQYKER